MSSYMESIIMFPPESIDRGLPSDGEEEFDVLVPRMGHEGLSYIAP